MLIPASIAALPGKSAKVSVAPAFEASPPNFGSPVIDAPQELSVSGPPKSRLLLPMTGILQCPDKSPFAKIVLITFTSGGVAPPT